MRDPREPYNDKELAFIQTNFARFSDEQIAAALSATGTPRSRSSVKSLRAKKGWYRVPGCAVSVASVPPPPPEIRPVYRDDELERDERHWRRCAQEGGFAVATPKGWYWPAKGERAPA